MAEADGRKRLERMTHLLGTDHFNEQSTPAATQDTAVTPGSPSVQLTTSPSAPSGQDSTVQVSVPNLKPEDKTAEPKAETAPAETPAVPAPKRDKRSSKAPPPEEVPVPPTEAAPSPPSVDASGPKLKATKIVDDQFHIEHVYESPEVAPPKKGKRQSSPPPAPPSAEAGTPEVAMPTVGEEMESVETEVPPSVPVPVGVAAEEVLPVVTVSVPVSPAAAPAGATHMHHGGGENHPKVPWSVKVPLDMYDFIREHDNYRPFLKDQRPFREKFLEWVNNVREEATPELKAAQDAAAKVRSGPADPSSLSKGGTPTVNKEPTL